MGKFYNITMPHKEASEIFSTLNQLLETRKRDLIGYTTSLVSYRLKFTSEEMLIIKLAHPDIYRRLR